MKHFLQQSKQFMSGILVLVLLGIMLPSSAFALKYKHIVAFGDSLSDHYNLKTYFDTTPEAMTNGDVWIEYLSRELNATLDNNAFIGAMTRKHLNDDIQSASDSGAIPQLGLIGQIDNYMNEANEFNPDETLFSIWIGSNNLIKYARGGFGDITPEQMITAAMTDIGEAITKLLSIGATQYIIMNLPDIGKSPWYGSGSAEDVAAATQLALGYNNALMNTINQLLMNKPGIKVYCFDIVQILDEIIEKEMFPIVNDSYYILDENGYRTSETHDSAEDYLFWDGVHPTTKAHAYFADVVATRVIYDGFYSQQELDDAVNNERMKWDVNNDNALGLEEAIHALKTCSKFSSNDNE
jgi:phospholipase/lecithinase/hemolysin